MRKIYALIALVAIVSCSKDDKDNSNSATFCWECETKGTTTSNGTASSDVTITMEHCGMTQAQIKQLETSGTTSTTTTSGGITVKQTTTTTCKKK